MTSCSIAVSSSSPVSAVSDMKSVSRVESIEVGCRHHQQRITKQCSGEIHQCNVKPNQIDKSCRVFVGDLDLEVTCEKLRQEFAPFGLIVDCKVIKDPQTSVSKGYGFVTFANRKDAMTALTDMNGKIIGKRVIKTNWAIRKHFIPAIVTAVSKYQINPCELVRGNWQALSFNAICSQTGSEARTIYCGGIMSGLNDNLMSDIFRSFGPIEHVRCFADKGYGFVRFRSKEDAAAAILSTHLRKINGHTVRCSWSKRPIASDISVFSTTESKESSTTANHQSISNHQATNVHIPPSTAIPNPLTGNQTFLCGCQQCQAGTTWSSYCSGCPICPGFSCQLTLVHPPAVPVLTAPSGYVLNWIPVLPPSTSTMTSYQQLQHLHPGLVYTVQQC